MSTHLDDQTKVAHEHVEHMDNAHCRTSPEPHMATKEAELGTGLMQVDPAFERRMLRRIDLRLIPALCE